ncbi:MAG: hypothetical protein ACWGSD_05350, partial [Thermodesulfobacteriota bacterium]
CEALVKGPKQSPVYHSTFTREIATPSARNIRNYETRAHLGSVLCRPSPGTGTHTGTGTKDMPDDRTAQTAPPDLRDEIFRTADGRKVTGVILADDAGIVAETNRAADESKRVGLNLEAILEEGSEVRPGDEIARFSGTPKQVVSAEDVLIGLMAKPSGIATAARAFVTRAAGGPRSCAVPGRRCPSPRRSPSAGPWAWAVP